MPIKVLTKTYVHTHTRVWYLEQIAAFTATPQLISPLSWQHVRRHMYVFTSPHAHNWVHPLAAKSHIYFSLCYVYMQLNFHLLMFSQECNVSIVLPCRNFSWVLTSFLGTMFGDTAVDMLSLQKPGSRLLINSISHSHASDKHKVSLQQKRHGSLKPLRYPHMLLQKDFG